MAGPTNQSLRTPQLPGDCRSVAPAACGLPDEQEQRVSGHAKRDGGAERARQTAASVPDQATLTAAHSRSMVSFAVARQKPAQARPRRRIFKLHPVLRDRGDTKL